MKIGYGHNIMYMLLCNQFYNVPPFETIKLGMRGGREGVNNNRGFSKWNADGAACEPASLVKRPKCRTDSDFWIHEFRDHFKHIFCRIDSYFWNHKFRNKVHFNTRVLLPVWQPARISFRKTSNVKLESTYCSN